MAILFSIMVQKKYQKNVLTIWTFHFFDNFALTNDLFAKSFQRHKTCLLVNDRLCEKLVSLVPILFDSKLHQLHF